MNDDSDQNSTKDLTSISDLSKNWQDATVPSQQDQPIFPDANEFAVQSEAPFSDAALTPEPMIQESQKSSESMNDSTFEPITELSGEPFTEPSSKPFIEPPDEISLVAAAPPSPLPMPSNSDLALAEVKNFSEKISIGHAPAEASYPFSLRITGQLTATEQEKLVELLNREDMGIREVDLEAQFKAAKVLIPRISEFAGIILIQALRDCHADIELYPSDEKASSDDSDSLLKLETPITKNELDIEEPIDQFPLTTLDSISEDKDKQHVTLGIVSTSAPLRTSNNDPLSSTAYHSLVTLLSRELKFKAKRMKADGMVGLQVQVHPLNAPDRYLLTLTATAVTLK